MSTRFQALVLLACLSAAPAAAQPPAPPPEPPAPEASPAAAADPRAAHLREVATRLALTDQQRTEVEPIVRAGFERRIAILKRYGVVDANGQRTGQTPRLRQARKLRGELEDVQKDVVKQLEPILSKTQLEEFRAIQQEARDAVRERARR